jgi:PIN domain nuclease of toxin-antitoxin system
VIYLDTNIVVALAKADLRHLSKERDIGLRVCDRPFSDVARQAAIEGWTRDPFDRLIVAQARLAKAALITRDTTMHANYAKSFH